MKGELDKLGEESAGVESISKMQTQILNLTKGQVNIFKDNGDFKDTYTIMEGISKVFSDLSQTNQAELLETVSGKQRANQIAAIIQSFQSGQAQKAYQASLNSTGSAMKENEERAKGLEYKMAQLKATIEKLSSVVIDSDFLKTLMDSGIGALDVITKLIDKFGLMNIALVTLTSVLSAKGIGVAQLFSGLSGGTKIGSGMFEDINKSIKEYNNSLSKSIDIQNKSIDSISIENESLGNYLRTKNGATASTGEYVKGMAKARIATIKMAAATMAMNVAMTVAVSAIIGLAVSEFQKLTTATTESLDKFTEMTDKRKEESASLDKQISKYKELRSIIESNASTTEQVNTAKSQLLEIQDNLLSSYYDEADGIDLVNGKMDDQIAKMKKISVEASRKYTISNFDSYEKSRKYLEENKWYSAIPAFSKTGIKKDAADIGEDFFKKQGFTTEKYTAWDKSNQSLKNPMGTAEMLKVYLPASTREEAIKKFNNLFDALNKEFGSNNPKIASLKSAISKQLEDYGLDEEAIGKQRANIEEYLKNVVISDDRLRPIYQKALDAKDAYDTAVKAGDAEAIKSAQNNIKAVKEDAKIAEGIIEGSGKIFSNLFSGLDLSTKVLEEFNVVAKDTSFNMSEDDVKLLETYNTKLKDIYDKMQSMDKLSQSDALAIITQYSDFDWNSVGAINKDGSINVENMATGMSKLYNSTLKLAQEAFPNLSSAMNIFKSEASNQDSIIKSSLDDIKELEDVSKKLASKQSLSGEEMAALISKYPTLNSLIKKTSKGYSLEEDALNELIRARGSEGNTAIASRVKASKAIILTAKANIDAINKELKAIHNATVGLWKYAETAYSVFAMLNNGKFVDWDTLVDRIGKRMIDTNQKEISKQNKELDKLYGEMSDIATSTDKTKKDKTKNTATLFDWIAKKLDIMAKATENAKNKIEDFYSLVNKNKATKDAISSIRKEIDANKRAITEYGKLAGKVSLSKGWKDKVKNGGYSISSVSDENTIKKIQEYQEYYDKINQSKEKISQLKKEELELYRQRLENIKTFYNLQKSYRSASTDTIQSRIDSRSNLGASTTSASYKKDLENLRNSQQKELKIIKEERTKYKKDLDVLYKSGNISGTAYVEGLTYVKELDSAIINMNSSIADTQNSIDNINYNKLIIANDSLDNSINKLNNSLDVKLKKGMKLSTSDYTSIISQYEKVGSNIKSQISEAKRLQSKENVNSDIWLKYASDISSLENELTDVQISIIDTKTAMFESLIWQPIERANQSAETLRGNLSSLANLIDDSDMFDKSGNITALGVAKQSLLQQEFDNSKKSVNEYVKEIDKLNTAYKGGKTGLTKDQYTEKLQSLRSGLLSTASETKSLYEQLNKLEKDRSTKEIESLKESIALREKALQKKKDYYDYDKQISEKTKDIRSLQSQIISLEGVTTAEGKARRARLRSESERLGSELKDIVKDHQIQVITDGFNNLSETLDTQLEELNNSSSISAEMLMQIKDSILGGTGNSLDISRNSFQQVGDIINDSSMSKRDKTSQLKGIKGTFRNSLPSSLSNSIDSSKLSSSGALQNINIDNSITVQGSMDSATMSQLKGLKGQIVNDTIKEIKRNLERAGY